MKDGQTNATITTKLLCNGRSAIVDIEARDDHEPTRFAVYPRYFVAAYYFNGDPKVVALTIKDIKRYGELVERRPASIWSKDITRNDSNQFEFQLNVGDLLFNMTIPYGMFTKTLEKRSVRMGGFLSLADEGDEVIRVWEVTNTVNTESDEDPSYQPIVHMADKSLPVEYLCVFGPDYDIDTFEPDLRVYNCDVSIPRPFTHRTAKELHYMAKRNAALGTKANSRWYKFWYNLTHS